MLSSICKFMSISTFACIASNEGEDDAEAETDDDNDAIEDDDDVNDDGVMRGGGVCPGRLGLVGRLSKGDHPPLLPSIFFDFDSSFLR